MALTYTPAAEVGTDCPHFSLPAVDGKTYHRDDFKDASVLVVMFICNHCPYVQAVESRLLDLARKLLSQRVRFVAISSNDPTEYPEDSFEGLKKRWLEKQYPFPYLFDESQDVAHKFGAVCTPDFFVYDQSRKLFYRGRLDDSWKDPAKVKNRELEAAIQLALAGDPPPMEQSPSMGCSIKWRKS